MPIPCGGMPEVPGKKRIPMRSYAPYSDSIPGVKGNGPRTGKTGPVRERRHTHQAAGVHGFERLAYFFVC